MGRGRDDRKDWAGQKYHSLTLVAPTDRRSRRAVLWEALCDCGNTTYVRPIDVIKGKTKGCGCLKVKGARDRSLLTRKYHPKVSSARVVWRRTYMHEGLTYDDFYRLSQLPCHYCNLPPSRAYNVGAKVSSYHSSDHQRNDGDFIFNGLDRVDSEKGHTLDNVVPCCTKCNYMKMDQTVEDFYSHCERILRHRDAQKL